jgi:hypothetical protein
MLQRIQSVYLALIVLIFGALFFMPFAQVVSAETTYQFNAFGIKMTDGSYLRTAYYVLAAVVIVMIYNIVILAYFKNRVMQIKLAKLNGIVLAMIIGLVVLSVDHMATGLLIAETEPTVEYGLGTYLLFLPLILNYLAIKAIRKDEELVRSADRLR